MTIKEVARLAKVSPSTVSNVLNGRVDLMTKDTLANVRASIAALNYRPNGLARGLVTRRTATIGLIVVEIDSPLFLQALPHVETIARRSDYNLVFCAARSLQDEQRSIDVLLQKQVDGIAFLSTSEIMTDDHIYALQRGGTPVVVINRTVHHEDLDRVSWDNAGGICDAVTYLAGKGHGRIALLRGPSDRRSADERLEGYKSGLAQAGIPLRDEYVDEGDYRTDRALWARSAKRLLSLAAPPSAIIASDDTVAAEVMRSARALGLEVPGDLSVVGVDNQPFCVFLDPPLSTVELPIIQAAKEGINLLIKRIQTPDRKPHHKTLKCPLIVRGTTAEPKQGAAMSVVDKARERLGETS